VRGAGPRPAPASGHVRHLLGALLVFGALNAFGGGYYGLSGAEGIPTEWLRGSPFSDFVVPSLILIGVVGVAFLIAAVAVFRAWRRDRFFALGAGAIVLSWLAAETAIIGYVSWMQPITAIAAVVILALAWRLPSAGDSGRLGRRPSR
jgi:hypothetical protein